jgi:uncharacterized protein (DUF934 family)
MMSHLLDQTGYIPDRFTRVAGADVAGHPAIIVPLADLPAALLLRNNAQEIGVEVENTTRLPALQLHLGSLALIAIRFPGFADGRGFSLARQLRRTGFTGRLRAVGPLIADQFDYALACGFDEIDLPEASAARQPFPIWQKARSSITLGYQRGTARGQSILDARRAARQGA